MKFTISNFLRRTFVAAGALLALVAAVPASAVQTVTLSGQTTVGSCTYTGSITVLPDGTLAITCTGTGTSTSAVFSVTAPSTLPINTVDTTHVTVSRSGGPAGQPATVYFQISGSGCTAVTNGGLVFQDGGAPQGITITTLSGVGATCTVTLTPASSTDSALPNTVNISLYDPNAGGSTPAGCPTPAAGTAVAMTLGPIGSQPTQVRMASGVISYAQLIASDPQISVALTQGQQAATPAGVTTEIQISKCPGAIFVNDANHPVASQCYQKTTTINYNQMTAYTQPKYTWVDQASLGNRGCWAPVTGGPWYVNVRWTYASCPFSSGCGFSEQWTTGPY